MSIELQRFEETEIVLDQEQTWRVLNFFWSDQSNIKPGSLTVADRGFAQALLLNAIDASHDVDFLEKVFLKVTKRSVAQNFKFIMDIAFAIGRAAMHKRWVKNHPESWEKVNIDEKVRVTLSRNFRSVWRIRLETEDLDY
jgi:hypothetical protein